MQSKDQVLFPKPVTFQIIPESNRTAVNTAADAAKVAEACILWGFGENSVVMLRDAPYLNCYQMGLVSHVKTYYTMDYAPLTIKWLNKPQITSHWPDELILVTEGVPDKQLLALKEAQKEPVYV
jgi:hypothetical protein